MPAGSRFGRIGFATLLAASALCACGDDPESLPTFTSSGTGIPEDDDEDDDADDNADDDADDDESSSGVTNPSGTATESGSSSTGSSSTTGDRIPPPADVRDVMRVRVDWTPDTDSYALGAVTRESSGTEALLRRAREPDPLGSFVGIISDPATGEEVYTQTIGTGFLYRELARGIVFRFPAFDVPVDFTFLAPDSTTGSVDVLLETTIDPGAARELPDAGASTTLVRASQATPALVVNIYAEGYLTGSEDRFIGDAGRLVSVLEGAGFPGVDHFEFNAVFAPSNQPLGTAEALGLPVPPRDSFLGMYYPYWSSFGRWYHIMYPTRVEQFRDGLAQAPYDYPIVITDSSEFWGTGNYNTYTAVPAANPQFDYLVLHEIGHFFGLNEEYSSDGTELLFAPGSQEPWSQNLTFQTDLGAIKWNDRVGAGVPIPTANADYPMYGVGAYRGGYAGQQDTAHIPVPDGVCTMSSGIQYCTVCAAAIADKIEADLAP